MATVLLGIGSNINAEEHLRQAAALLRAAWPAIRFSAVYESAPREVADQPIFLNAAATLETVESIEQVHARTVAIERALSKAPPYRFGPRTIDIDILLYDTLTFSADGLTVPHPRMMERRFVLEPLSELMPFDAKWQARLEKTLDQHCERIPLQL